MPLLMKTRSKLTATVIIPSISGFTVDDGGEVEGETSLPIMQFKPDFDQIRYDKWKAWIAKSSGGPNTFHSVKNDLVNGTGAGS